MALVEIKVPDIGDFDEVAVIELLAVGAEPRVRNPGRLDAVSSGGSGHGARWFGCAAGAAGVGQGANHGG